jgi:hypothetical protein
VCGVNPEPDRLSRRPGQLASSVHFERDVGLDRRSVEGLLTGGVSGTAGAAETTVASTAMTMTFGPIAGSEAASALGQWTHSCWVLDVPAARAQQCSPTTSGRRCLGNEPEARPWPRHHGSECECECAVLAHEPPDRVIFSWNISPSGTRAKWARSTRGSSLAPPVGTDGAEEGGHDPAARRLPRTRPRAQLGAGGVDAR